MKYYLAYGSNLNKRQMARRCPDAVPVGTVTISNYELVFRGVATIEPKIGASVQCAVWKISAEDERSLDRYEGYPRLYVKQDFGVQVDGKSIRAMAYVMTKDIRPKSPPPTEYLRTIMEGYEDFGLDDRSLIVAAAGRRTMRMTYLGLDSWSRPVYEDENGKLWKDVDPISDREPHLCSSVNNAFDGEPDCPYHPEKNGNPEFIPQRVIWR